jgi:SET domain-containing protein
MCGADARIRPPSQKVMTEIYKPLPEIYYRPLPEGLTIAKSKIEGIGLFATKRIKENTELGITHIKSPYFENGYIRTPLGGFINHFETPNCFKEHHSEGFLIISKYLWLVTSKVIEEGEELTVKYTLYNLK